jgi:hypothetical protein
LNGRTVGGRRTRSAKANVGDEQPSSHRRKKEQAEGAPREEQDEHEYRVEHSTLSRDDAAGVSSVSRPA